MNDTTGLKDPDRIFEALSKTHEKLDDRQGRLFDARLVLLLADRLGDDTLVLEAIEDAARGIS